jgi:uncharacterized membrane protein
MTSQKFIVNNHDLLGFTLVCHIAFVINTSSNVLGAYLTVHSAGDQTYGNGSVTNFTSDLTKVSLGEGSEPAAVYLLGDKIFVKTKVPEVVAVGS